MTTLMLTVGVEYLVIMSESRLNTIQSPSTAPGHNGDQNDCMNE